jgi:uncharacterized protein YbcV (DUF1398 family)
MDIDDKIQKAYKLSKNYPELVRMLNEIGVQSYTVDAATSTIIYRLSNGEHIIHPGMTPVREISARFNEQLTIKAIRDNQQGKSDYPGFMNEIANAGVRFYEATLAGHNRRVTYIGSGGFYEEMIPA